MKGWCRIATKFEMDGNADPAVETAGFIPAPLCGGEGWGRNFWGRETKNPTTIEEVKGFDDSMKRVIRRRIVLAVALAVLAGVGWGGWRIGRVLWRSTGQF